MTYAHITILNVKMYKNVLYYIIDKLQHRRQSHAPMATKILHTSKTFCELTNRKVHESTRFHYVTTNVSLWIWTTHHKLTTVHTTWNNKHLFHIHISFNRSEIFDFCGEANFLNWLTWPGEGRSLCLRHIRLASWFSGSNSEASTRPCSTTKYQKCL